MVDPPDIPPDTFAAFWETHGPQLQPKSPTATLRAPRVAEAMGEEHSDEVVIERRLGEGGMGLVDLALQTSLERRVAVKRVGIPSTLAFELLVREARIVGGLEHPNIVPIHGLRWDASGQPLLIMKRIEGVPWSERLKGANGERVGHTGESLAEHLEILLQVCNGIEFAHSRGVLHRDIKPENIMIGAYGEVVVLDWGIATYLAEDRGRGVVGTPAYMAPEMVRPSLPLSVRTDVYLLGATLHEALMGSHLHRGTTVQEVLEAAWESKPFTYPASVPPELAAIALRATRANPDERFASVGEFRDALAQFSEHRRSLEETQLTWVRLGTVGALDHGQRHRRLLECRFAFEAALRSYPENARAEVGLEHCLSLLLALEVERKNLEAAQELLAEFPGASPEDHAKVHALQRELTDLRTASQSWSRMTSSYDVNKRGRDRARYVAISSAVIVAGGTAVGWLEFVGAIALTHGVILAFLSLSWAFVMFGIWVERKRLLETAIDRQFATLLVLSILFLGVNELVLGVCLETPVTTVIAADLLLWSFGNAFVSVLAHRHFRAASALYMFGALLAAWCPEFAYFIFAGVFSLDTLRVWLSGTWEDPVEKLRRD